MAGRALISDGVNWRPFIGGGARVPVDGAGAPSGTPYYEFTIEEVQPTFQNTGAGIIRPAPTEVWTGTGAITTVTAALTLKDKIIRTNLKVQTGQPIVLENCIILGGPAGTFTGDSASLDTRAGSVNASNVTVTWSTFDVEFPDIWTNNFIGHDTTLRYCKLLNGVDNGHSYNLTNSNGPLNMVVEGCFMDQLAYFSPCSYQDDDRTHNDNWQVSSGTGGMTFRGNTMLDRVSSTKGNGYPGASPVPPQPDPYYPSATGQCIALTPAGTTGAGEITGVAILGNWFDYGASSITGVKQSRPVTGFQVSEFKRNKFGRNQPTIGGVKRPARFEPILNIAGVGGGGTTATSVQTDTQGNVWQDNNEPILIYRS